MEGVTYIDGFSTHADDTFKHLKDTVCWDERMSNRKTASYGVAYNYSQISYPFYPLLPELVQLCTGIEAQLGFMPNNCLINYYPNGKSKMGFHSDQTDILESGTGVVIISLGQARILRFREINDKTQTIDFELSSGSLLYMTQDVQAKWEHAIPEAATEGERMSLTFRKIK